MLFYFTHSQEAYPGVGQANKKLQPVYHPTVNITNFTDAIVTSFAKHQVVAHSLEVDTMQLLTKQQKGFDQAYATVRPHVKDALQKESVHYVIDFHRDSAKRAVTTLETANGDYAKLMFIVGGEHEGFEKNKALAEALSKQLERQVPGISRGVLVKKGRGVDGIYNQDLHPASLLIELGGIENQPHEVEAAIEQIALAIDNL